MKSLSQSTPKSKTDRTLDLASGVTVCTPVVPMTDVLKVFDLPAPLEPLRPLIEQLPYHVMSLISTAGFQHGFDDEQYERALRDAVSFQERPAHRCACCFRWCDPGFLVLTLIGEGRFVFAGACRRCERLIDRGRVTPAMQRNLDSLIDDELAGGDK